MAVKERARAVEVKPASRQTGASPVAAMIRRAGGSNNLTTRLPSPQVASAILAGSARAATKAGPAAPVKAPATAPPSPSVLARSTAFLGRVTGVGAKAQAAASATSLTPAPSALGLKPMAPAPLARTPIAPSAAQPPAAAAPEQATTAAAAAGPAAAAPAPQRADGDAAAAKPADVAALARDGKDAKDGKDDKKGAKGKDAGKEGGDDGAPKKEARSPRDAIAPAAAGVRNRAGRARSHSEKNVPGDNAQAAAKIPAVEKARGAADATVSGMAATGEKAGSVPRASFRDALKQKIRETTKDPTTEAEASRVRKQGATDASSALRGELTTQRDAAAGPMKDAAKTDVPPDAIAAPPEVGLKPEPLGKAPAPVSGASVVPEALPAEKLDYSSDREPTDRAMADAGVTKDQLEKGNEPAFGPTIEARSTAEKHEAKAEAQYRKGEDKVQDKAQVAAKVALAQGLGGMHGARGEQIGKVVGQQNDTQSKDAAERKRITDTIAGIKETTKGKVDGLLNDMDAEATRIFEAGLKDAESLYEKVFEDAKGGAWTWLTTWGDDWEELIEKSLGKARQAYLDRVDQAIDAVADYVDAQIVAAKDAVAAGLEKVKTFVAGLDTSVQEFGKKALETVTEEFTALETQIDERRDALVDKLAEQYKASYERMSAMEEKLREENKSLWQRVYDATVGLIKKILAFKDMLLSILAKAAGVISDIIADPIGFLGNLVSGVMLGLKNFMGNIGAHLKKGLLDWLFGALGGAGLVLPETLDLKGIVSIVLQVLGLTYANFRKRAVAIVGEPIVAGLEQAAEVFKILITEGIPGLWRFIQEKLNDLKAMVLDAIFDFIKEKVIVAGVTWIIGLLNPASAFFKACKAIYDIVMFFINRGSQILELVNAVIDSMAAIAKGSIGVAADFVEKALAKAIPVAIGFLASLLGLGDISGTIRKTIDKAQAPVNKAIDWVIHQAVKLVKAAGGLVKGLFGKKEKKETPEAADPETSAKIAAGLAQLHEAEAAKAKDGRLGQEQAEEVAASVKKAHPVFRVLEVRPVKKQWTYHWEANPTDNEAGALIGGGAIAVSKVKVDDEKLRKKLSKARHTSGAEWELAVGSTIIKDEVIPELEEDTGIPISLAARGSKEFERDSAQYLSRAKWQRGHRKAGEQRQPDLTMEVMQPGGKGALSEVVVMEITLVNDFIPTRRDPVHKVDQFEHTIKLLKDKYGTEVPIRFIFFVPEPPTPETEQFLLDAIAAEGVPNIKVEWRVVAV